MKMPYLIYLMVFLISVVLVGGLITGCSLLREGGYSYTRVEPYKGKPWRYIPIWVDKNFGEGDRLSIEDAVSNWNYALNGYLKLEIVDFNFDMETDKIIRRVKSGGWLILKIDHTNAMVPAESVGKSWLVGFTERIGGHHLYLVRDRLKNETVVGVTMHEIGHMLGSRHVGEGLMHPQVSMKRFRCIDFDTMVSVAKYRGLLPAQLNYCVEKEVVNEKESISCPL